MASHEGSRKRLKISRTESKPSSSIMASTSASAPLAHGNGSSCTHEQSLKALQTDIDAMRQIVTCKICHRLLYEPYSLACGHTYCYSCLSQWLVDGRKKTCPDCRAVVNQQPTPSYLIRELVLVFVSRNELLPDGETTEEHHGFVKEEADLVAKDKANADPRTGGLFRGCFKRGYHGYIGPIHDAGDGVDRCPNCNWELEEGFCNTCGEMIDPHEHLGFSDYDDESEDTEDELDHELDLEDAAAVFGADGQDDYLEHEDPLPDEHRRWLARERRVIDLHDVPLVQLRSSDDEDESEADDEGEGNLTGFVVDDDNVEYQSSEDEGSTVALPTSAASRSNARRRAPIVVVSDDDHQATASAGPTSESEEDSEDEGPVALGSQRHKRGRPTGRLQRGRRTVSSDDEESLTHDEEEDHENAVENYGGFSPLDSSAVGGSISYQSGYDSDGVSTVHPMDDEDRYGDHGYRDDDDEEDDESDGSDAEAGWDIPHETPAASRQPPSTSSHRLHNLGGRSNRYTDSSDGTSMRNMSPANRSYRRNLPSTLDPYPTHPQARARFPTYPYYGTTNHPSQPHGMFRPPSESVRLPPHPFQLGNTLNEVNSRTAPLSRTYNQRNHHVHRAVSSTSSRSSATGGVEVQGSSSGSSSTLRVSSSVRRKRLLSISSDDSVEEARRSYDY